jgi:hypothetical protein
VTVRVMVPAAWYAAERCLLLVRVIARAPTNSARFASVTTPSCLTCSAYDRIYNVVTRAR